VRLTVYGPKMNLHSGHYGNYAPNPAQRLTDAKQVAYDEYVADLCNAWRAPS
jgi:hypothetical protein